MREFRKAWANVVYRIIDEEKYKRYWWGRRPRSREMVEDYLFDSGATQRKVSMEWGGSDSSITKHLRGLIEVGAMEKVKAESNRAPADEQE